MKASILMGEYFHKWGKGAGLTMLVGLEKLYEICPYELKMWSVDRKPKDL